MVYTLSEQVGKVFLRFSSPFWPPTMSFLFTACASQLFWRPEEGHKATTTTSATAAATGSTEGSGTGVGSDTLVAYFGGQSCLEAEQLGESGTISRTLADLETIFLLSDLRSQLLESRFVNWGSDPWAQMGYSFDAVWPQRPKPPLPSATATRSTTAEAELTVTETRIKSNRELRKALGKPWGALHFAGEACPPLRKVKEYATVHGALASGEHAARAVLAALAQHPR